MPPVNFADHVDHVNAIVKGTLAAADPARALGTNWPYALTQTTGPCYVVGAGKAALEMAVKFDQLFEGNLAGGVVAVVPQRMESLTEKPKRCSLYQAGQP